MSWISNVGARILPANFGPLRVFDAHTRVEGSCGDTMEFWASLEAGRVSRAAFTSDGCMTSVACGSAAAHMAVGLEPREVRRLRPIDVLEALGIADTGEGEEAHHCADLALSTLGKALEDADRAAVNEFPCLASAPRVLGWIRTPHRNLDTTPFQPTFAAKVPGEVFLDPALAEGLDGLAGFSHAFLIYHLHEAKPGPLKVKPFMTEDLKGVFACRFPDRPNAIGLSLVRLQGVEGNRVLFTGADMLDGTPLLDIKPYYPMADRPREANGGWTDSIDPESAGRHASRMDGRPSGV